MLLGFGGKNFYSFKEDFDVTLEHKDEVLSVLGIKGANASGKTNAILALSYIRSFMYNSFSEFHPDDGMYAKPFFDSKENIQLYIHFKIDNIEYKYEIEFTQKILVKEVFSRKESRWTTMFIREGEKVTECINELDELTTMKVKRTNVSTISLAHQHGIKELDVFYTFAKAIITNVDLMGKITNNEHFLGYQIASKIYFNNNNY